MTGVGIDGRSALESKIVKLPECKCSFSTLVSFDRLKSSGCSHFVTGLSADGDISLFILSENLRMFSLAYGSCVLLGEEFGEALYTGTGTLIRGSTTDMTVLRSVVAWSNLEFLLRSVLSETLSQSELWYLSDSPSLVVLSWITLIFLRRGWLSYNILSLSIEERSLSKECRNVKSNDPGSGGVGKYFSASNALPKGKALKLSLICGRNGKAGLPPYKRMYRAGLNMEGGGVIPKDGSLALTSFGRFSGIPFRSAPSQNLLCLLSDVIVENAWPQSVHLICCRQSACIRLWRHRLENWVYAFKQTSHWNGLTLLWMWRCCFNPLDVAKVFPQSGQAWLLAPMCCERIWRWRFEGSVNVFSQCSQENRLEFSVCICQIKQNTFVMMCMGKHRLVSTLLKS